MLVKDLKKLEIELTTRCNARCPGCARTFKGETNPNLPLTDITLANYKKILPSKEYIKDKEIHFSGVLGDPAVNPEFYEICEYTLSMDPDVITVSTNGGIRTKDYWTKLGTLSSKDPRLAMGFAVDGLENTNHLYRVNVKWNKLLGNMTAYSDAGGRGEWMYNPFDFNIHEIDEAKQLAKKLGFLFFTRYSTKQEDVYNVVNKKTKEITSQVSLTNKKYLHPEVKNVKKDNLKIKCKLTHEYEIFIGANYQMWPCCYLHDNDWWKKDDMIEKFSKYGLKWNDTLTHTIQDILNHEWYSKILEESWNKNHPMFLSRCQKSCSNFGNKRPIFERN